MYQKTLKSGINNFSINQGSSMEVITRTRVVSETNERAALSFFFSCKKIKIINPTKRINVVKRHSIQLYVEYSNVYVDQQKPTRTLRRLDNLFMEIL